MLVTWSIMKDVTRILLADDHPLVRRGIRSLLDETDGVKVVGEARDGLEVVTLAEQLRPDLIIMDISMPLQDGLTAAVQIKRNLKSTRILFLTMHRSASLARQAKKLGIEGYVLKGRVIEELGTAVKRLAQGDTFLSPSLEFD